MIISNLKIYYIPWISPSKRALYESFETMLYLYEEAKAQYFANFSLNYIKKDTDIVVKIPASSFEKLEIDSTLFNYASITDVSGTTEKRPFYYFIRNIEWCADGSVRVYMHIDVLNTFKYHNIGYSDYPDFSITRALVKRRHRRNTQYVNVKRQIKISGIVTAREYSLDSMIPNVFKYCSKSVRVIFNGGASTLEASIIFPNTLKITFSGIAFALNPEFELTIRVCVGVIDNKSEDITPPLYKISSYPLDEKSKRWYLMYRNANNISPTDFTAVNPVDCFVVPEQQTRITYIAPNSISASTLSGNADYAIFVSAGMNKEVTQFDIIVGTDRYTLSYSEFGGNEEWNWVAIHRTDTTCTLTFHTLREVWNDPAQTDVVTNTITGVSSFSFSMTRVDYYLGTSSSFLANKDNPNGSFTLTGTSQTAVLNPVSFIDRTDARIIKIIKLPYFPSDFEFVTLSGQQTIDLGFDPWSAVSETGWGANLILKLLNTDTQFFRRLKVQIPDPIYNVIYGNPIYELLIDGQLPTLLRGQYFGYDPKCYKSDFTLYKLLYDSFSLPLPLECREITGVSDEYLHFKYGVTKSMNSRFLLVAEDWLNERNGVQDFPGILYISRNNEMVLYNSAYVNYIKNGYNYDVKNKERAETSALIQGVGGVAAGVGSLIAGLATENPVLAVTGAVSAAASIAGSTVRAINQSEQNNDAIARNIKTAKMQGVTISGADDLDIMEMYGGDTPRFMCYQADERTLATINDIFYLYGYKTYETYTGEHLPTHTKLWFDYIEADIEIATSGNLYGQSSLTLFSKGANLSNDLITEIKALFNQGVTIYHPFTGELDTPADNLNNWDVWQTHENFDMETLSEDWEL